LKKSPVDRTESRDCVRGGVAHDKILNSGMTNEVHPAAVFLIDEAVAN
jgi:hypothetical protein